ncbi:hypothetical protein IEO21_02854 [Rhodonia placenta]|uniref:Uncharacterized protein n=1 Tax=Rhodonia placenta TaxID=104341 RepID=A0A8H7P7D1_9APHY|nr:hypothetical protein IEO21_02854 [Postia placenta]
MLCSFWLTAWVHISFPLYPAGLIAKMVILGNWRTFSIVMQ